MEPLIPRFILERLAQNQAEGSFSGTALFLDIAGFTSITDQLMRYDKEGAEVLSVLMHDIFTPIIDMVYDAGGFITSFAGDAFTAVFPDSLDRCAPCAVAWDIAGYVAAQGQHSTRFGDFVFTIRQGLGFGPVHWGIVGPAHRKSYFFRGAAIGNSIRAEKLARAGEVVLDNSLVRRMPDTLPGVCKQRGGHWVLTHPVDYQRRGPVKPKGRTDHAAGRLFLPAETTQDLPRDEFRAMTPLFISFKDIDTFQHLDRFAGRVLTLADSYGGYMAPIDFGDKGGIVLIMFGIPQSFENNIERAVALAWSLRGQFAGKIRAAVTHGTAFACFTGSRRRAYYGALGDTINVAARLTQQARWGEVLVSQSVAEHISGSWLVQARGPFALKGKKRSIRGYALTGPAKDQTTHATEQIMIGRQDELTRVLSWCHTLFSQPGGGVIYIYGDAGIGKSTLLRQVRVSLQESATVCMLHADPILQKSLRPFAGFFMRYFNQREDAPAKDRLPFFLQTYQAFLDDIGRHAEDTETADLLKELRRIKSILAALVGLFWQGSVYERLEAKDKPAVMQQAVGLFFRALAGRRPLAIMVEDLHWLDGESISLLQTLADNREAGPAVVITSRLGDDGTKPTLHGDVGEHALVLEPLKQRAIREMATQVLQHAGDQPFFSFIAEKTRGNPYYIEQVCHYIKEHDLLQAGTDTEKLQAGLKEIPTGIVALLTARLDRLSPRLRDMVQLASVLGTEFEQTIFHDVCTRYNQTLSAEDFAALLGEGERQRIWHPLSAERYMFRHTLLCEAAYDMQSRSRIRSLHNITGQVLADKYTDNPQYYAEIAYHYAKTGNQEKAAVYYHQAADDAHENWHTAAAMRYYTEALALVRSLPGDSRDKSARILLQMGTVLSMQAKYTQAIKTFSQSQDMLTELYGKQHPDVALTYNFMANLYQDMGDFANSRKCSQHALSILLGLPEQRRDLLGSVYNNLGTAYWLEGKYDEALKEYEKALAIQEPNSNTDDSQLALTYDNIGSSLLYQHAFDKAMACFNKALQLQINSLGENHPQTAGTYISMGVVYSYQQQLGQALAMYNKALAVQEEVLGAHHPHTAITYYNLGRIYMKQEDFLQALTYLEKAEAIQAAFSTGDAQYMAMTNGHLGKLFCIRGAYGKSIAYFRRALDLLTPTFGSQHPYAAAIYCLLGTAYTFLRKYALAEESLTTALRVRETLGDEKGLGQVYAYLAYAYMRQNKRSQALRAALESARHIQQAGDVEHGKTHLIIALLLSPSHRADPAEADMLSAVSGLTGIPAHADAWFNQAIKTATDNAYHPTLIPALYEYGAYLCRLGDREGGKQRIAAAEKIAQKYHYQAEYTAITELKKQLDIA